MTTTVLTITLAIVVIAFAIVVSAQRVSSVMRDTIDTRLGDSFRHVAERLEEVHRGLGEMRALAAGVGDLKKILANVHTRGGWGEVQLGALLEQMLAPSQFERQFRPREGSAHVVEFALKLPGRHGDGPVYLPIDAKFPLDDYQRLVDAVERGDREAVDLHTRDLDRRLRACAKDIHEKYVCPPLTTDFAILFLPVEGLYAEALRTPALAEQLQREWQVMIAGPTTLAAILSSLQLGFRTLAIEQHSGEVWRLLGAVKSEFAKFGSALVKVKKSLEIAANRLDDVAVRSRAIERQLKRIETLPGPETAAILEIHDEIVLDEEVDYDELQ
jgi:DNA recombination protein RmuC